MEGPYHLGRSVGAAATMAAVTLAVFWVFRDYGPESAIRRFHQAALGARPADIQAVTLEPLNDPATVQLVTSVRSLVARGGAYPRVARAERERGLVRTVLLYQLDRTTFVPSIWVVKQIDRVWKVSALETLEATQYLSRPAPAPNPNAKPAPANPKPNPGPSAG